MGIKRENTRKPGIRPAAGRRNVARPDALLELSTDWTWEQDAELRFTRVDTRSDDASQRRMAAAIVGKQRWDTGVEVEGGWEAHRALLEARAPFRDVLMWRRLDNGSRRYFSVSGDPVFAGKDRFAGYRGIARDVTKQKRIQQLLKLQYAVTSCLAEASVVSDALSGALQAICEAEGWDCAEFWRFDDTKQALLRLVHWIQPGDADAQPLIAGSSDLAVKPGAGLLGSVWQTGELMWLADATEDPRGMRKALPERSGLRGAALLPVRYGGRVAGVLNFHCRRVRPPDRRLIQALNAIVTQIGQFLQRVEAEEAVRESEARFRSLTDLSSDWYWEQDAEHRFVRLEGRHVAGDDPLLRNRLLGARRWESDLNVEGGWDAHRALLDARKPFYDVLLWRTMPSGTQRYMRVSGEAVYRADGSFAGYRGVGRDVTTETRAAQMLTLEHGVAGALTAAADVPGGLKSVIKAVCRAEGWACGRYFRVDPEEKRLEFRYGWSIDDPAFEKFVADSRNLSYALDEGLGGVVWKTGEALWTPDVSVDPRAHAATIAGSRAIGIRGVFAMPVKSESKVIGVISFSSPRLREPDQRLLAASRVIGGHVGQFLHRKHSEDSLRESEARFRMLTQMSSDFSWETNESHQLALLVYGPNYAATDLSRGTLGKTLWDIPSLSPDEVGWAVHRAALDRCLPFREFELSRLMPDGVTRHYSISGDPRFADDGRFLGYRGVGRDITEIAVARDRVASLAYSDPLTGLANRTSLGPSLDQAVQRARRRKSKLAVVFLDLDGFKPINDVHGHDVGDALLIELAGRLRTHLRSSDLIARLGGDEFLVVIEEVSDATPAETVARKLLSETALPYALGGRELQVTASIGISVFPDDASDSQALMKHADTAMYAAKQAGKNTLRFYTDGDAANDPRTATGRASDNLS